MELGLLLESWQHTKDEMRTKIHFATIIIWFMYLARGMIFFLTYISFLNYAEYYQRKAKIIESIFKKHSVKHDESTHQK